LQKAFLEQPRDAAFTEEQIEYASADAEAAARLYPLQMQMAMQEGVLQHLVTIEMPWVLTNARMVWRGSRWIRRNARR
jgi:DNA polymerase-1